MGKNIVLFKVLLTSRMQHVREMFDIISNLPLLLKVENTFYINPLDVHYSSHTI